ncbi:MAG: ATP-binding protein [Nibricoccus sp.]
MDTDLLNKALTATKESRSIEFKEQFDPDSRPQWLEIIKDIVAIANSGGGVLLFGINDDGDLSGADLSKVAKLDPAVIADKVSAVTGRTDLVAEVHLLKKSNVQLVAFSIQPALVPFVFEKAGAYDPAKGEKAQAFAKGTLYFRHGAKSEPASAADITSAFEKYIRREKRFWMSNLRKVTTAPAGSVMIAVPASEAASAIKDEATVRPTNNPKAPEVILTRDKTKTRGTFLHEKVTDTLFEDINNVLETNFLLSKDTAKKWALPPASFYAVYARRTEVPYSRETYRTLLQVAFLECYSPGLYWATKLPVSDFADTLAKLYLFPRTRDIHSLLRVAVLLGAEFADWLFTLWTSQWKNRIQKPSYYQALQEMKKKLERKSSIAVAAQFSPAWYKMIKGQSSIPVSDLLKNNPLCQNVLTSSCREVATNGSDLSKYRQLARQFDYMSYGEEILSRNTELIAAIKKALSGKKSGELDATTDKPEEDIL